MYLFLFGVFFVCFILFNILGTKPVTILTETMPVKLEDYVPKKDTQQRKLLKKYPKYDGRGLLIAILDNGIDVSTPGLQQTTTFLPKIIDCFDFTGNGRVDTSVVKEVNEKNILIGLSGRKLKIPSKWKNPSGKWHLGSVSLYELCFGKEKKDGKHDTDDLITIKKETAEKLLSKNTLLDCIVWFNGKKWQACCDTTFGRDLKSAKVLTNYRDEHEYGFLLDDISYCVTISNDGNLLEIAACTKAHGTLVAHTAAGCFPWEPERNGLAPGAQIVSMNVMTTNEKYHESIRKALLKCIELQVDIVNLCIAMHEGHEALIKEMVEEHGIIFVKSAGNTGPGYRTILASEHSYNDDMFFIGSVLTPEMKEKFYKVEQNWWDSSSTVCLYSSKGPLLCGSRGITFTAPGGVIVSLPKWSTKVNELCLGTSFACPIVGGSIACLLSGLKANAIKYTPNKIRIALSNTAKLPYYGDRLQFGSGIIQIYLAFKYCCENYIPSYLTKRIIKPLQNDCSDMSGILYNRKEDDPLVKAYTVKLKIPAALKDYAWKLKISSEEAEEWIEHPETTTNDSFNIKIDTTFMEPGTLNYAEIHGFDPINPSIGPLFHFPITVFCPEEISAEENFTFTRKMTLASRIPYRFFMIPQEPLRKCVIKITALQDVSTELYISFSQKRQSKILPFTYNGQVQECIFLLGMTEMCEISICHSNLSNGEITPKLLKFNLKISLKSLLKDEENSADEISRENIQSQTAPISSFLLI